MIIRKCVLLACSFSCKSNSIWFLWFSHAQDSFWNIYKRQLGNSLQLHMQFRNLVPNVIHQIKKEKVGGGAYMRNIFLFEYRWAYNWREGRICGILRYYIYNRDNASICFSLKFCHWQNNIFPIFLPSSFIDKSNPSSMRDVCHAWT